ncbi:hypothetical protein [Bradyrhizobium sp. SZCCHNRI2010]|uniref:hypothetical protein n=1 Tax=Bradyrhizobium sp. SZCCHNRI2010 TaxID=3057283 RepID=UPI0028E6EB80|nr:hypothetical protein [Bradyrhizobium sp. SZCCHNRI2010]
MTKHARGRWSLESSDEAVLGSITQVNGRFHLNWCGVDNSYPTLSGLKLTMRLLGHRLVERDFQPKREVSHANH